MVIALSELQFGLKYLQNRTNGNIWRPYYKSPTGFLKVPVAHKYFLIDLM